MPTNRRPPTPGSSARPGGRSTAGSGRPGPARTAGSVPRSGTGAAKKPATPRSAERAGTAAPRAPRDPAPPAVHEVQRSRLGLVLPEALTVRGLVLAVVLAVVLIVLVPTVRAYVNQTGQLHALEDQLREADAERAHYQVELDRWDDRAYVIAQARERLSFVLPGETAYRVLDPGSVEDTTDPGTGRQVASGPVQATHDDDPWYSSIWGSVEVAGTAGAAASG